MTKQGLDISVKGFVMDLVGTRRAEQEKVVTTVGYEIAKVAFELLVEEVKKAPFEHNYVVSITAEKIEQNELRKIVDLILYDEYEVNKEINELLTNVDGIKKVEVNLAYDPNDVCLKVKAQF